ncbi:hypothetical protein BG006_003458, partial [Podila minutissima]
VETPAAQPLSESGTQPISAGPGVLSKVSWIVNSVYEGTMYLSSYPLTRSSRDVLFCFEGSFQYRYGFPGSQMTLTSKYGRHRYYPEVHVWNERDDDWAEVEYWDCVNVY